MLPVVVLAGGLGTRVAHLTGPDLPKALLPIDGTPFIDLKLAELAESGASEVCMLVGHGSEPLRRHVGDAGDHGLDVSWLEDGPTLLGTGGAVARYAEHVGTPFWLTYGDTLLEVPMAGIEERFLADSALMGMTVLKNRDRWEPSNVTVSGSRVVAYEKGAPPGTHHWIDYGMSIWRPEAFDPCPSAPFDLGGVVRSLIDAGGVAAYPVHRRFYDIGNDASIAETTRFVASNRRGA